MEDPLVCEVNHSSPHGGKRNGPEKQNDNLDCMFFYTLKLYLFSYLSLGCYKKHILSTHNICFGREIRKSLSSAYLLR